MRRFLVVLRSFFHSSLLCTFSCHPSPLTIHPSSLTSSCHLFLGLPLNLVVPKFIYNTLLGIIFSSILCTCLNQRNLFNLYCLYYSRFFLTLAYISLLFDILQFSFSLSYTGPDILLYTFLSKMFNCSLSLFVSVQVSDAYVNVLSIIVFFSLNFSLVTLSFIYLFINSIPKSTYRSSSSGYRNSQRISNLAVYNREPATNIGSLE